MRSYLITLLVPVAFVLRVSARPDLPRAEMARWKPAKPAMMRIPPWEMVARRPVRSNLVIFAPALPARARPSAATALLQGPNSATIRTQQTATVALRLARRNPVVATAAQCAYLNTQCTQGVCVANQCQSQARANGTACNDGNACTINDVCVSGVCSGNPGQGQACVTGQPGICSAGTTVCQGGSLVCIANNSPSVEVCDGVDNNCNGQIDESLGSLTCGTGQCQRTVQSCIGGVQQTCSPGSPSAEICDGLDNNCNGQVDKGLRHYHLRHRRLRALCSRLSKRHATNLHARYAIDRGL